MENAWVEEVDLKGGSLIPNPVEGSRGEKTVIRPVSGGEATPCTWRLLDWGSVSQ